LCFEFFNQPHKNLLFLFELGKTLVFMFLYLLAEAGYSFEMTADFLQRLRSKIFVVVTLIFKRDGIRNIIGQIF